MIPPHTIICAAAFCLAFGDTLAFHATPFYAFDHLGGGAAMSGNFGAVQAIVYTVITLSAAGLVTRVKHGLNLAIIGTAIFAFTYGAVPFISMPWPCIFASAIGLGGMAITWPAIHSWVGTEPDPVVRARHMSWLNMSWSSGAAISPLFAGPLYDVDYRYPFVGSIVFCGVVIALLRMMPHEGAHFPVLAEEVVVARAKHDKDALPFLWPGWLSVFVFNMLNSALRLVYPKHIDNLVATNSLRWFSAEDPAFFLTHSPATIFSILAFAISIGTAAAFLVMGRTSAWKHRFATLVWPQVAAAVALLVLATTRSLVLMAIAFAVIGAGLGVCFFSSSYCCMADPKKKHRRASINEGMVGAGSLLGSFGFGQLAVFGVVVPFLGAPLVIGGLVAAQYTALRHARRKAG